MTDTMIDWIRLFRILNNRFKEFTYDLQAIYKDDSTEKCIPSMITPNAK